MWVRVAVRLACKLLYVSYTLLLCLQVRIMVVLVECCGHPHEGRRCGHESVLGGMSICRPGSWDHPQRCPLPRSWRTLRRHHRYSEARPPLGVFEARQTLLGTSLLSEDSGTGRRTRQLNQALTDLGMGQSGSWCPLCQVQSDSLQLYTTFSTSYCHI